MRADMQEIVAEVVQEAAVLLRGAVREDCLADRAAATTPSVDVGARPWPDCGTNPGRRHRGTNPGQRHRAACEVERCSECGGQRVGCDCEGHDPNASTWTGQYPPIAGSCPGCGGGEPPANVRFVCPEEYAPDPDLAARPPESFVGRHVKKMFPTGDPRTPSEHMWVFVRDTSGGKLIGSLDNAPVFCGDLELGDPVEVAMEEIERAHPEFD